MIIVKVGEPKTKNLGDVWFDPTTKVSQRATAAYTTTAPIVIWRVMTPSPASPMHQKGDIRVDPISNVPVLWDGTSWISAVPTNYNYPPANPGTGTSWIEPMTQTPYIFFNGKWCELSLVVTTAGQTVIGSSVTAPQNVNLLPPPTQQLQLGVSNPTAAHHIRISGPNGLLVDIDTATGNITYGQGYTPDAAAQEFWTAIASTSPKFLQTRIEELVLDLKDVSTRLAVAEGNVLKFKEAGFTLPEPPKPFNANESWEKAMGIIK